MISVGEVELELRTWRAGVLFPLRESGCTKLADGEQRVNGIACSLECVCTRAEYGTIVVRRRSVRVADKMAVKKRSDVRCKREASFLLIARGPSWAPHTSHYLGRRLSKHKALFDVVICQFGE